MSTFVRITVEPGALPAGVPPDAPLFLASCPRFGPLAGAQVAAGIRRFLAARAAAGDCPHGAVVVSVPLGRDTFVASTTRRVSDESLRALGALFLASPDLLVHGAVYMGGAPYAQLV